MGEGKATFSAETQVLEGHARHYNLQYHDTAHTFLDFPSYIDAEDFVNGLRVNSVVEKLEYIKSHFPVVETDGVRVGVTTDRKLALSWGHVSQFHLSLSPYYIGWVNDTEIDLMYERLKESIEGRPYPNDASIDPIDLFKILLTSRADFLIDFNIRKVPKK